MDKKEALYWMEEYESYWNDACCELQELRKLIGFEYTWKDKKLTVIEKGYFGAGNDPDKTAESGDVTHHTSFGDLTIKGTPHVINDIKRSKKVDVPTEQWQKDIERRLKLTELDIKTIRQFLKYEHKMDIPLYYGAVEVSDKS